jgi:hypothetical protein
VFFILFHYNAVKPARLGRAKGNTMTQATSHAEEILKKQVEFDGSKWSREATGSLDDSYRARNQDNLQELKRLQEEHDQLAKDMNKEIDDQRTLLDEIRTMTSGKEGGVGRGFRGVLGRIPLLGRPFRRRPLADLLSAKVDIADAHVRRVGEYLKKVERTISGLHDDQKSLQAKKIEAARGKKQFVGLVLELKVLREELEARLRELTDANTEEFRQAEAHLVETDRLIWEHGQKMQLFDHALHHLDSIMRMNQHFTEISKNLHANMTLIRQAAELVLDELRQHASRLATLAEAGQLSLQVTASMESLKESMNRVAVITSETSLFLTRNVEQIVANMTVYDRQVEELVEKNLAAEKELRAQQLQRILEKAEQEQDTPDA